MFIILYHGRYDADIALIVLETELTWASSIVPICMLSPGQDFEVKQGIIVGYGQSEDKTKLHETKPRKLTVPIKRNEECFLDNFEFAKISSNRTFCAGSKNDAGACRGDSGSGLFIKIRSTYYLKGLVSSSLFDENGYCDVKNFAVYTNIPQFLRWIENPLDPASVREVPENSMQLINQQQSESANRLSCGVMNEASGLIQGGKQSSRENFPWAVAIFVKQNFDLYEQKAVGTLITNKHVVSLGNPIANLNNGNVVVPVDVDTLKMYFGISSLSEQFAAGVLIIEGAEKIVFHPNFKIEVPRSADVSLIFLQSPIVFTKFISPACLSTSRTDIKAIVGRTGYAVGWGINESGSYSELKKQTGLQVQNQTVCKKFYSQYISGERYFCAMSKNGATPCDLDDPFYLKLNGKWFLRGLINIYFFHVDDNKCSSVSPVLYEDMTKYSNWIESTIK